MSDLEKFKEVVDDVWEMVLGTKRRPQSNEIMDVPPKRARTKGRYKADDLSTAYTNEAWVGGKAPTEVKTVGYKKRKKNDKK